MPWKIGQKVFHTVENHAPEPARGSSPIAELGVGGLPRRQVSPRLLLSAREFGDIPMKAYVGITDRDWFDLLSHRPQLDEVNFCKFSNRLGHAWQTSPHS